MSGLHTALKTIFPMVYQTYGFDDLVELLVCPGLSSLQAGRDQLQNRIMTGSQPVIAIRERAVKDKVRNVLVRGNSRNGFAQQNFSTRLDLVRENGAMLLEKGRIRFMQAINSPDSAFLFEFRSQPGTANGLLMFKKVVFSG